MLLKRLASLTGGTTVATALLPLLEGNGAIATAVPPEDNARLTTGHVKNTPAPRVKCRPTLHRPNVSPSPGSPRNPQKPWA